MQTVNMHEAKDKLSQLVARASAGEVIIVTKGGEPVAQLGPLDHAPKQRKLGWLQGQIDAPDDIKTPFNHEIEDMFGGQNA
jgi:prevent-host-death family protein